MKSPDLFQRFRIETEGVPLAHTKLAPDMELLVFERGDERRALLVPDMVYRHLAQGELAGEPLPWSRPPPIATRAAPHRTI